MGTPVKVVLVEKAFAGPASSMRLAVVDEAGAPRVVPSQVEGLADSEAEDVVTLKDEFNALLAKLREAKVLTPSDSDSEEETDKTDDSSDESEKDSKESSEDASSDEVKSDDVSEEETKPTPAPAKAAKKTSSAKK